MSDPLAHGYDWAWAYAQGTITAQNVVDGGGKFVIRYVGGSASLTPAERDDLFAHGLLILPVMEQEATMMEGGFDRGVKASYDANAQLDGLGCPGDVPLFFADDNSDADTSQEVAFADGVEAVKKRPPGCYSGGNVLAAIKAKYPWWYTWRVETWYPNDFGAMDIEQLANTRDPAMPNVDPGEYDTDLLFTDIPMWGPNGTTTIGGIPPTPVKKETSDMFIGAKQRGTSTAFDAAWIDGGFVIRWLDGSNQQPWAYGATLPQAAFDLATQLDIKVEILSQQEWEAIEGRTWLSWQPPAGGSTPTPPAIDAEAVAQAVIAAVDAGPLANVNHIIHDTVVAQLSPK
jgi:hypothetical protein